jgi:hypothetical protein
MTALYARARLVLRPFYHHHEPAFARLLQAAPVLLVPLGYGRGTHSPVADTDPTGPASGLAAALEWLACNQTATAAADGLPERAPRDVAWAFAGRLGVHASRAAMSNVFATGWADAPSLRAIDRGGTFAGGPLPPHQVAQSYRRSKFVPSPPGNSPDCFRHWEAVTNGAVPLLEGRATDYAWGKHYFTRQPHVGGGGSRAVVPFRAPLGVVFAGEGSEDAATSLALDAAGFELHAYALVRRQLGERSEEAASEQCGGGLEAPWRLLLRRAQNMGEEELALRRDLNARYWVAAMTEARHQVQEALAGAWAGGEDGDLYS